jgi:hypothetical protein
VVATAAEEEVVRRRGEKFEQRLRKGHVVGMRAQRQLRKQKTYAGGRAIPGAKFYARECAVVRGSGASTTTSHARPVERKHPKVDKLRRWKVDGHSGESDEVKKQKKKEREERGMIARYVRGCRACQGDNYTVFIDRDVNGSVNIGVIWLADNVEGLQRHEAFDRRAQMAKKKKLAARGATTTPLTNRV